MIDLKPYYDYEIIRPGWSMEKIADEIALFTKFQIDELFRRGVGKRTTRQERKLDNILQGIITRKDDPILTVKQLDAFIAEKIAKWGHEYIPEKIKGEAENKFISHRASVVYELYCLAHPRVTPEKNIKHKDVDFWVDGFFAFDLKVTNWPKDWDYVSHKKRVELFEHCVNDPSPLVRWMYIHQGENRFNWQNRLFIICYNADDFDHRKLIANFDGMKEAINTYFNNFDPSKLIIVSQEELRSEVVTAKKNGRQVQETALADVIWNYKDYRIHPPRYPGGLTPMDGFQPSMF